MNKSITFFCHPFSESFQSQEKVGQCERTLTSLRTNLVLLIRRLVFRKSFSNSWYVKRKSNIWPERYIHWESFKLQFNYESFIVCEYSSFFVNTPAMQSRIPIIQSPSSLRQQGRVIFFSARENIPNKDKQFALALSNGHGCAPRVVAHHFLCVCSCSATSVHFLVKWTSIGLFVWFLHFWLWVMSVTWVALIMCISDLEWVKTLKISHIKVVQNLYCYSYKSSCCS